MSARKCPPGNARQQMSANKCPPNKVRQKMSANKCPPENVRQKMSARKCPPENLRQEMFANKCPPNNVRQLMSARKCPPKTCPPGNARQEMTCGAHRRRPSKWKQSGGGWTGSKHYGCVALCSLRRWFPFTNVRWLSPCIRSDWSVAACSCASLRDSTQFMHTSACTHTRALSLGSRRESRGTRPGSRVTQA